jgi:kanamycin kinase
VTGPEHRPDVVPAVVAELAGDGPVELAWRNELGGLTFRVGELGGGSGGGRVGGRVTGGRFVKWNPRRTGIDLDRERRRLVWLAGRHPAPRVLTAGADAEAQWLVTEALPGESAVGDTWRLRPSEAIRAIATGLRALHAVAVDDFPAAWTDEAWVGRTPASLGERPPVHDPVLVHGDACAPNTLVSPDGRWTGNVDFGDLAVGDRWADLAVASMSLDWNYGEGHQGALFDAYGIEADAERIRYYRALWHLES